MAVAKAGSTLERKAAGRLSGAGRGEDEESYARARTVVEEDDDLIIDYTSPQATDQRFKRIQPSTQYYIDSAGLVNMGSTNRIERSKLEDQGWRVIPGIPAFDVAHAWTAAHPFDTLFQFNGAKHMPVSQITEMGYHFNPPLVPACGKPQNEMHNHDGACYDGARPVVFPQLRAIRDQLEGPFSCQYCSRADLASKVALEQHMSVAHKEERGDIRTGVSLADHLLKGLRPTLGARPAAVEMPVIAGEDDEWAAREEQIRASSYSELMTVLARAGELTPEQKQALVASGLFEESEDGAGNGADDGDD